MTPISDGFFIELRYLRPALLLLAGGLVPRRWCARHPLADDRPLAGMAGSAPAGSA